MSFFGIGPMELIFILIIMVLVLGPKNMVESAKKFGVTLRKLVKSPFWTTVMDTSREIREIPTRLIREAGIEEDLKNLKSTTDSIKNVGNVSVPLNPLKTNKTSTPELDKNTILPEKPISVENKTNSSDSQSVNDPESQDTNSTTT